MPAPRKVKLPPRKKSKKGGFCWATLFSGITLGILGTWLFMSGTVNLQMLLQTDQNNSADHSATEPNDKEDKNSILDNLPIEFYKLLPNQEEQIPEHIISQQVQQDSPEKPMDKPGRYRLQAGSFQKLQDADRRRASILILGLETHIEKVTHGGRTWHRIMLGPFESLKHLEVARHRLKENQIDTIVLRLKPAA